MPFLYDFLTLKTIFDYCNYDDIMKCSRLNQNIYEVADEILSNYFESRYRSVNIWQSPILRENILTFPVDYLLKLAEPISDLYYIAGNNAIDEFEIWLYTILMENINEAIILFLCLYYISTGIISTFLYELKFIRILDENRELRQLITTYIYQELSKDHRNYFKSLTNPEPLSYNFWHSSDDYTSSDN